MSFGDNAILFNRQARLISEFTQRFSQSVEIAAIKKMQNMAHIGKIFPAIRKDLQSFLGKLDLSKVIAHPNIPTNFSNR